MTSLQSFFEVETSSLDQCVALVMPCAQRLLMTLRDAVGRLDVRELLDDEIDAIDEPPSPANFDRQVSEAIEACELSGLYSSGDARAVMCDLLSADLLCESIAWAMLWYHDMPEREARAASEGFRGYWVAKFKA